MGKIVWVKCPDHRITTIVEKLGDDDYVDDLRKKFVNQEGVPQYPSRLAVYQVGEDGKKIPLDPGDRLFENGSSLGASPKSALLIEDLTLDHDGQEAADAKAPPDSSSIFRRPIVLAQYGGIRGVDANNNDLQLMNAKRMVFKSPRGRKMNSEQFLEIIKTELFPSTTPLKFLNKRNTEIDWNLWERCWKASSDWLDKENVAKRVFPAGKNEQLQMHLGGSSLVLYPLLFASDAINRFNNNDQPEEAQLPANAGAESHPAQAQLAGSHIASNKDQQAQARVTVRDESGITSDNDQLAQAQLQEDTHDEPGDAQDDDGSLDPLVFNYERLIHRIDAQLFADADWDSQEVLTHTEFGERLMLKMKADAWLRLQLFRGGGTFKTPIFHFEHKTSNLGKAQRKAVLLSQLTWRRIFLACAEGCSGDYKDRLREANDMCKDLPIWFACLEGTKFQIGALKGQHEHGCQNPVTVRVQAEKLKKNVVSYAKFKYAMSPEIDVVTNGKQAKALMYALSRHLPYHVQKVISLLPDINDTEMDQGQDYSKAMPGSKRKLKPSSKGGGADGGGSNKKSKTSTSGSEQPRSNKTASGYAMKQCVIELLNNDVTKWNGSKNVVTRGARVVVKAFSGDEELDDYDNEVSILEAITSVPHVQELVMARKADHIDFAIVVSTMQPTTSRDIRSIEDIQEAGQQVLRALVELRILGIIHRDIKPSNILWCPTEKRATLIDFGLATRATMERSYPRGVDNFPYLLSSSGNVGTEGFQAPEVLSNHSYDEKIDVYSLGKTLQNIAAAAGIQNNTSLDEVVDNMTKEDPVQRCTAPEALGMAFFC